MPALVSFPPLNDAWSCESPTAAGQPGLARGPRLRLSPPTLDARHRPVNGASLQVDFIIISRRDDGSLIASIVDPHGDHLADAKAKLRGLADYADRFGHRYVRIESIAKVMDGRLRSLDLLDAKVRDAVRKFEGGKVTVLYESASAADYQ